VTETKSIVILQTSKIHVSDLHCLKAILVLYDYMYLLKVKNT